MNSTDESPRGDSVHVFVSFAGGLLDMMVSDQRMWGTARRAKRDGNLDYMYKQIMRYVLWVESLEDSHESQRERMRRGKRMCTIIATVRQNES